MEQIELFLKRWPRTVILMLLGGLVGWIAWMFLPQQYAAVSHFSVTIDYNRTGSLDNLQEDRLLGITEDILHSDAVMEEVFRQSSDTDYKTFYAKTLTTRTNETWALSITGHDPEELSRLALYWLDIAYDRLDDALTHAYLAEEYEKAMEGLTGCIQNSASGVTVSGCPSDPAALMSAIDDLMDHILTERAASHGISSAVCLGGKNPGQLEIRPASRSAAMDTLLGAMIGFIISFAIVWVPRSGKEK